MNINYKGVKNYGKISTESRRVTDRQRACFKISMMLGALDMDLPLENIKGYSVNGMALFTQVTIHSRTGETYTFTGFPAKKLQGWLAHLGVQKL